MPSLTDIAGMLLTIPTFKCGYTVTFYKKTKTGTRQKPPRYRLRKYKLYSAHGPATHKISLELCILTELALWRNNAIWKTIPQLRSKWAAAQTISESPIVVPMMEHSHSRRAAAHLLLSCDNVFPGAIMASQCPCVLLPIFNTTSILWLTNC